MCKPLWPHRLTRNRFFFAYQSDMSVLSVMLVTVIYFGNRENAVSLSLNGHGSLETAIPDGTSSQPFMDNATGFNIDMSNGNVTVMNERFLNSGF